MKKLTYYAVLEPSEKGSFCIFWPDLPGCTSWGENLKHAEKMAEEALGLHLYQMEQDGDILPEPTMPPFVETSWVSEIPDGAIVMPISIFPDIVKNELDNRAVKTNITLPAWLKDWAGLQGINLSQTLQTTLRQMYGQNPQKTA
ncbi:antitoxin HicB [Spirochaetia bacterium]|nr:antitoxin HicB [Spirochaetia bacterium]